MRFAKNEKGRGLLCIEKVKEMNLGQNSLYHAILSYVSVCHLLFASCFSSP
jgi:hypothetical protein